MTVHVTGRIAAAVVLTLGTVVLAACSDSDGGRRTVTLVTHDSFAVAEADLDAFERAHDARVRVLKSGDAGTALNQVILTKDDPIGDVMFGVDTTFLTRATRADVFAAHQAPGLADVPTEYQLDPSHELTPIDVGDVCVNYDRSGLAARGVPPPTSLEDLARPAYRGLFVTENAATSSPGLAFLLATIAEYGDGWQGYWARLRANDVLVTDGWEQAYFSEFSGGGEDGDRPLVTSYASSPPVAVLDAEPSPAQAPTAAVLDACFRQVEFAGVIRGTGQPALARALVDWMLSDRFQRGVLEQMFVYPVREGVPIPPLFERLAPLPPDPFTLDPREIGRHRSRWIDEWTDIVLR
jgi:thiamine transport system substrate-binding protein